MDVLVLSLIAGLPLLALLAAVVVVVVAVTRRPLPAPSEAADAARRHALGVNIAAWVVLTVLPLFVFPVALSLFQATAGGGLYAGVVAGLWPATAGLLFLGVHAIGERTWPRPTGVVRRAHLSPRDAQRGPRWLRRLTWTWAGLLLITLVAAGATSSNGHAVSVAYATNAVVTASPYPGWYYGIPLLAAAALVLVATEGVLRLIARRPAVVDADPAYDAASRRLSAHRALRGTQLVLALTDAGVLGVMSAALSSVDRGAFGVGLGLVATLVGLAGLVAAVVPARPAVQAIWPGATPTHGRASLPPVPDADAVP